MKILMLTSSFPRYEGDFSGPWILEYCRELVRQGHQVTVVAPTVTDTPLTQLSDEYLTIERFNYWYPKSAQKLVHPPGMIPQLKDNPLRYFQIPFMLTSFLLKVFNLCKQKEFDIVHSQWVIPAGFIGALLTARYKLPHVITSQGAEFFLPQHHPFSYFTKFTLRRCDCLFPVSAQMAERALSYGVSAENVCVVPNTVNPATFQPSENGNFRQKHNIASSTTILLTIRRLVHEKRVEDVIAAFSNLPKSTDASLIIGGDGPEKLKLQALCKQLDIEAKVKFIGFVDNKDLPPIYAASDLYILSSQQEGLSLSLLEAMSSGLVTITTDTTGGDEVIQSGENGFTYTVGDTKELTRIINQVLTSSPQDLSKWSSNARKTVIENYSVSCMVKQWTSVYEQLLKNIL